MRKLGARSHVKEILFYFNKKRRGGGGGGAMGGEEGGLTQFRIGDNCNPLDIMLSIFMPLLKLSREFWNLILVETCGAWTKIFSKKI